MINAAVVGTSDFGVKYIRSLGTISEVKVSWVSSLEIDQCKSISEEYGIQNYTDDIDVLCNDPLVDVVVVVTPESTHRQICETALKAGKHVIVEKPLATNEEDGLAILEAWKESGKMLMTSFLLRFDYRYAQIKEKLQLIEPVRQIHAYRNFDRNLFESCCRTHSFVENAIHDIDLIMWYVGSPVKETHSFCRTTMGLPNPDINIGIIEFENGVIATVHTSWFYPRQRIDTLQWNAGIQVMGDGESLSFANDRGGFRGNVEGDGIILLDQTGWADIHGEPRGAFGAMLRHYIACIQGVREYNGVTPQEAMDSMRVACSLADNTDK